MVVRPLRGPVLPDARGLALAVLCTAFFIEVVDTTIVSIALPSIQRDLAFSTAGGQWVLNAYALVFGGLLLLFGRVADLHGRKRIFQLGLVVFTVGSLLAALASDPLFLIAGRFVQGAGAAAFVPASLSLMTAMFSNEDERGRAIGVYGAMAALGFVTRMVGGGIITELWGWRWIFFVNVPVAAVMLPAAARPTRSRGAAGRTVPNGAIALQSMVGIAWLYVLTLYFQDVLDEGALRTGLLFAPMTLAALVAAPLSAEHLHAARWRLGTRHRGGGRGNGR